MKFDAIVIGSGQAGNPLSHRLADRNWRVALIEEGNLGGTCINTGCTPTKTMLASAQVAYYARNAVKWGVLAERVRVDLPAIVARQRKVVESFRAGQQRYVDQRPNIKLYRGHAKFISPKQVQVGAEIVEGDKIFINTGTRPEMPNIPGLETVPYLTNASILELQELPTHLLILGGGYIGLEFGQMFRRFGSQVTIVHRGERILPREDPEITQELQKVLQLEGIAFELNANTNRAEKLNGEITLTIDTRQGPRKLSGSNLLVATGRRPNTDDLGLENAGVETNAHGYVKVNGRLETGVPGIWALGDVKGGPAFTHISYNDFQIVFGNLVDRQDLTIEGRYLPYSLFTDPQLGRVGVTEKEARATGGKLKIGSYPMAKVARAIERDETAGLMKIIVDAGTDRILGAAILGAEGGELIQILGALILARAPYTVLKGAVYIHPTLAEGFFGLMESVKPVN
jgi:pyruvate/2-oxoglutarate dehydrogenase complex dihydrolipoamide dehydrogenase (E3) component